MSHRPPLASLRNQPECLSVAPDLFLPHVLIKSNQNSHVIHHKKITKNSTKSKLIHIIAALYFPKTSSLTSSTVLNYLNQQLNLLLFKQDLKSFLTSLKGWASSSSMGFSTSVRSCSVTLSLMRLNVVTDDWSSGIMFRFSNPPQANW